MINGLCFIAIIFAIISYVCINGFALFLAWKFLDLKYFSTSDIELLREENKYLREENKKVHGTSDEFWSKERKMIK